MTARQNRQIPEETSEFKQIHYSFLPQPKDVIIESVSCEMKKSLLLVVAMLLTAFAFSQTKTEIKPEQLPKGVSTYLAKNFSDYSVVKAFKIDNKGAIMTETMVTRQQEKYTLTFDKDAKLIKKEAVKPDTKPTAGKDERKSPPSNNKAEPVKK
jgi:hypothetical protein